jgi:hypothetical protein
MYAALRYFTNTIIVVRHHHQFTDPFCTRHTRQLDRPLLQQTQDAAHAALDLLSLLAEAEVEQMRLGAMDPVAAIARRAHVSLAAQLTDRLELHLSRWVVLVNERVTLASRSSSSPSRSSSVSTSSSSFSPPQSPHAPESDSSDVHYHIACYLGLEGILRERQSLYEHLGQSPEQVGDDVKASVRLTITMTKGLLDVIRVNDEQHQVTLRYITKPCVSFHRGRVCRWRVACAEEL